MSRKASNRQQRAKRDMELVVQPSAMASPVKHILNIVISKSVSGKFLKMGNLINKQGDETETSNERSIFMQLYNILMFNKGFHIDL